MTTFHCIFKEKLDTATRKNSQKKKIFSSLVFFFWELSQKRIYYLMSKKKNEICAFCLEVGSILLFSSIAHHTKIATQLLDSELQNLLIRIRYWSRAISFSFQTNCLIATTIFPPAINWGFFGLIKNHEMKLDIELLTMLDDELAGLWGRTSYAKSTLNIIKGQITWLSMVAVEKIHILTCGMA